MSDTRRSFFAKLAGLLALPFGVGHIAGARGTPNAALSGESARTSTTISSAIVMAVRSSSWHYIPQDGPTCFCAADHHATYRLGEGVVKPDGCDEIAISTGVML